MKTHKFVSILAVALGLIASHHAWGAAAYFDNFDSTAVGSPPTGWTVGGQTSAIVTNAQSVSSPNSVQLYTPLDYTSGSSYMSQTFGNSPTDPLSYFRENIIAADVRLSSTNQFFTVQAVDSVVHGVFDLRFYNGSIQAWNGGSLLTLGTFTSNEWYHVVMTTLAPSLKYSVSVYDSLNTLVASGANFGYQITSSPITMRFIEFGSLSGSPVPAMAYVDNIFVGVPEPSSIALVIVAGLVVLRLRRRN